MDGSLLHSATKVGTTDIYLIHFSPYRREIFIHEDQCCVSLYVFECTMDYCELWFLGRSGLCLTFCFFLDTGGVLSGVRSHSWFSQNTSAANHRVFHIQVLFFVLCSSPTFERTSFHFCFSTPLSINQSVKFVCHM